MICILLEMQFFGLKFTYLMADPIPMSINWLVNMECYFDCYEMYDGIKIQFAKRRLVA